MTFEIEHDGKRYVVHTEVGNGTTDVVFDEEQPRSDTVSERDPDMEAP